MSDATDDPFPWHMDSLDVEPEVSISLMAKWHDEGRICGECQTEFVKANGEPSACEFCKRRGSELPLTKHEEKNRAAHKAQARQRRQKRNG